MSREAKRCLYKTTQPVLTKYPRLDSELRIPRSQNYSQCRTCTSNRRMKHQDSPGALDECRFRAWQWRLLQRRTTNYSTVRFIRGVPIDFTRHSSGLAAMPQLVRVREALTGATVGCRSASRGLPVQDFQGSKPVVIGRRQGDRKVPCRVQGGGVELIITQVTANLANAGLMLGPMHGRIPPARFQPCCTDNPEQRVFSQA